MPNFMTGFMQGYDFVDRNKRLDRQETRLDDDRSRQLTRQQKQDERTDQAWEQNQEAIGEQKKLRSLQGASYLIDSPDFLDKVRSGDQQAISALQEHANADPRISAFTEMLSNPDNQQQTIDDIATLESGFQGKSAKKDIIDAANRVLKPFLNHGTGGENKRLVDIFPSQSGKGFYAELEMEENGQVKRAPLTGPNRSAEDTDIKEIPAAELAQALGLLKQHINSQRVALGDTSPIAARAESAKLTRQHGDKLIEQTQEHELEMTKLVKQYDLKEKLEKLKVRSGTSGNAPADQQLTEYLVHNKIYPDRKSAWAAVRKSKSDPVKLAAELAAKEIKSQNDAMIGPDSEGYRTPEQIRTDALNGVIQMYEMYYGTEKKNSGAGGRPSLDDIF